MTLINCVTSCAPGKMSGLLIAIICNFIVFGTAAWKFTPLIVPEVLEEAENRAVTFTMLGFDGSCVGVNEMTRPEIEELKAFIEAGAEETD